MLTMSPQELKDQKLIDTFNALIRLMKAKPFETISITELTRLAKTSRTYFYKNFDSLDDIISQFEMLEIVGYIRRLPNSGQLAFAIFMKHYFQLALDNRDSQLTLMGAGKEQVLIKAFNTAFHYLVKNGWIQSLTIETMDPYLGHFYAGAVVNVSVNWLRNGAVESPLIMGEKLAKLARQSGGSGR